MIDVNATVLQASFDAFAQPVTYLPGSGAPVATRGIFVARHSEVHFENEAMVETTRTRLDLRASELAGAEPVITELVRVAGALYEITEVQPDGQGMLQLTLRLTTGA